MSRLGILVALPSEARCLDVMRCRRGDLVDRKDEVTILIAGVGRKRARHGAERLIRHGATGLLSFGIAAGLVDSLETGRLVIPVSVITDKGDELRADATWRDRLWRNILPRIDPVEGALAETLTILADGSSKKNVHAQTGAVAADMESGAVAEVARDLDVPFVVVRAISDPAAASIPVCVLTAFDEREHLHFTRLARSLIRRPRQVRELWSLRRGLKKASETLEKAYRASAERWCFETTRGQIPPSPSDRSR